MNEYIVYRHINNHDEVIYVGKTKHGIKQRTDWHYKNSHWYPEIYKIDYTKFDNQTLMHQYENYYICLFKPKYNKDLKDAGDPIDLPSRKWEEYEFPRIIGNPTDILYYLCEDKICYNNFEYSHVRRSDSGIEFTYCKYCGSDQIDIVEDEKNVKLICHRCGKYLKHLEKWSGGKQLEYLIPNDNYSIKNSLGNPIYYKYFYKIQKFDDQIETSKYGEEMFFHSINRLKNKYNHILSDQYNSIKNTIIEENRKAESIKKRIEMINSSV